MSAAAVPESQLAWLRADREARAGEEAWRARCRDEGVAKMERGLMDKRRARLAAQPATSVPAQPATSGRGWRITEPPGQLSHEELERLARHVLDCAFHGMIPWPKNWRVRFGEVDPDLANPLSITLAATVYSAKVIIMDRRYVTGRTMRGLVRTVVHELKHVLDPDFSHGPVFDTAVDRAVDYILDGVESTPPQPVRPTPATPPAPI